MGKSRLYENDVVTVKQLGEKYIKVTYLSSCRIKGMEEDSEREYVPKSSVNTEKLDNNISRAKSVCKELVLCNPWDYWCTFTISPEKYDRYNLKKYIKDFTEFIHNYNRRCNEDEKVKYLFIPEMHEDGAWHIHGFIRGIREKDLYINSNGYLTWKQYEDKFGYISMSKVRDVDRASSYMMKYMTKDIAKSVTELGAHIYYCSNGLERAKQLYKGHADLHCEWDWEHPDGYCKVKTFDTRYQEVSEYLEIL